GFDGARERLACCREVALFLERQSKTEVADAEPRLGCDAAAKSGNGLVGPALVEISLSEVAPGDPRSLVKDVVGERLEHRDGFVVPLRLKQHDAERVLRLAEVGLNLDGPSGGLLGVGQAAFERRRGAEVQIDKRDEMMRFGVLIVKVNGFLGVSERT